MKRLRTQIIHSLQLRESWIIFFILGIIMMTFPFLHIFNKPVLLFGVPLLFLYLMTGWIISIFVIYLFMIASRHENKSTDEKNEL
jgi:Na+-driven multidrug efflux pump